MAIVILNPLDLAAALLNELQNLNWEEITKEKVRIHYQNVEPVVKGKKENACLELQMTCIKNFNCVFNIETTRVRVVFTHKRGEFVVYQCEATKWVDSDEQKKTIVQLFKTYFQTRLRDWYYQRLEKEKKTVRKSLDFKPVAHSLTCSLCNKESQNLFPLHATPFHESCRTSSGIICHLSKVWNCKCNSKVTQAKTCPDCGAARPQGTINKIKNKTI